MKIQISLKSGKNNW